MTSILVFILAASIAVAVVSLLILLVPSLFPVMRNRREVTDSDALRIKPKSAFSVAMSTIHPFKFDIRVILAIVLGGVSLAYGYYILFPFALGIGYLGGDLFLTPAIKDMLDELGSMVQYATDLRSGIRSASASSPAAVIASSLGAQHNSVFAAKRLEAYTTFTDFLSSADASQAALQSRFETDTNPFSRILDFMTYLLVKRTDLKIVASLEQVGVILTDQIQSLTDAIVRDLMETILTIRMALVVSIGFIFLIFIFYHHTFASDFGASVLAQLLTGVISIFQIIWMYFTRRPLSFDSRYL